jgi:hypothetical protein
MRNAPYAKKGRMGIGQWEKQIEDKKPRPFEKPRRSGRPGIQIRSKAGPPAKEFLSAANEY